eukprot:GILJ01010755.1.p1 GENE.GILJ01010755.1~~GILJ01010755.1.p1  ORF type:complete len:494 (+),score=108.62 GILJ01010755.1:97-1578(+)
MDVNRSFRSSAGMSPNRSRDIGNFSASSIDRLRTISSSSSRLDAFRAVELRELQEEEASIQRLRSQREKIEGIKLENERKDKKIAELQAEIEVLQAGRLEAQRLQTILKQAEESNVTKSMEIDNLRRHLTQRVEEYERAFHEMRQQASAGDDDRNRELARCRAAVADLEAKVGALRGELSSCQTAKKALQDTLTAERDAHLVKDRDMAEQITAALALERKLKEQVADLSFEKGQLHEKVVQLQNQVDSQNQDLTDKQNLVQLLNQERQTAKNLAEQNGRLQAELDQYKNMSASQNFKLDEEVRVLRNELDNSLQLIGRQENTIAEFRLRRHEDERRLVKMKEDLTRLQHELESTQTYLKSMTEAHTQAATKASDMERHVQVLRGENSELRREIQSAMDREEIERRERQEWAKARLDLFNQRASEVARLQEALEGVTSTIPVTSSHPITVSPPTGGSMLHSQNYWSGQTSFAAQRSATSPSRPAGSPHYYGGVL